MNFRNVLIAVTSLFVVACGSNKDFYGAPGSYGDFQANAPTRVHFDFGDFRVPASENDIIEKQAAWVKKEKDVRVLIEGHCDERGTTEYNLGLGAKRAASLKRALIKLGVQANSIRTVTYGKERPCCVPTHPGDEKAHACNRRAETVIE
ncbi:MAG: OmpA family protein [Alphaproteobacteria bacterium]